MRKVEVIIERKIMEDFKYLYKQNVYFSSIYYNIYNFSFSKTHWLQVLQNSIVFQF